MERVLSFLIADEAQASTELPFTAAHKPEEEEIIISGISRLPYTRLASQTTIDPKGTVLEIRNGSFRWREGMNTKSETRSLSQR